MSSFSIEAVEVERVASVNIVRAPGEAAGDESSKARDIWTLG